MKYLISVCGPNGSGKTTFTNTFLLEYNFPIVDPDRISSQGISDIKAGKLSGKMIKTYLDNGVSFIKESTLTSIFDVRTFFKARSLGYQNILIYLSLPSWEASYQRVQRRVATGGHDIPIDIIKRRFNKSLHYFDTIKDYATKYYFLESSNFSHQKISSELSNIIDKNNINLNTINKFDELK